jgi:hypothetical protein
VARKQTDNFAIVASAAVSVAAIIVIIMTLIRHCAFALLN